MIPKSSKCDLQSADPLALQNAIDQVSNWSEKWELPLSAGKTMVLSVGSEDVRTDYRVGSEELDK